MLRGAVKLLGLLPLLGCFGSASVPERAKASGAFRWAIENGDRRAIELWLFQGHILIESAPADSELVEVAADVTVHAETQQEAERLLAGVDKSRTHYGERKISLQLTLPLGAALEAVETTYRILVPPGSDLRVFTSSGRVAIRGYRGKIRVESESGDIVARLDGGDADLASATGMIRFEGTCSRATLKGRAGTLQLVLPKLPQDMSVDIESVTGPIEVELPDALPMDVLYQTQTGKLDFEVQPHVTEATDLLDGGRLLKARFGPDGGKAAVDLNVRCEHASFTVRRLVD